MNKFAFHLENALKYRQRLEEQEEEHLVQAMKKVQLEEGRSTRLKLEKLNYLSSYDCHKISLITMQQQTAYLAGLDSRIEGQRKQLEQARKAFSSQRARVIKASTTRKTLEQLKGKYFAKYQLALAKEEQKVLDEVGIVAYCRKANNY